MSDSEYFKKYLQYLTVNESGREFKGRFDDDWEPIGPQVRQQLIDAGLARDAVDWIELTDAGRAALASK